MGQRILLFEADESFAQEVQQSFEALGVTVDVASDGEQGLDIAASNRPDLILLTIELPRMNGFLVCKKIKKLDALSSVPLLILSSEATEDVFEQHKKLRTRAEDYIHKPIAFADLLERTKRFMEIRSNGNGERTSEAAIEVSDLDDADMILVPEESEPQLEPIEDEPAPPLAAAPVQASFGPRPGGNGPARPDAITALSALDAEPARAPDEGRRSITRGGDLEAQLAQAERRAADAEQEAQAAKQRAATAEKALAETSKKGGASSRELLDLREQLNRKDRELLTLRDQVTARDRQLVEASDRGLVLEREAADLSDRQSDTQRDLEKLKDTNAALLADKEAGRKRFEDAKARLERSETRLRELSEEMAGIKATHAKELDGVGRRHAEMSVAADAAHARAMEQLKAETAAQLEAMRRARGEELASLRDEHAMALNAAREQAEQQKQLARAELRTELEAQAQQRVAEAQARHEAVVSQALAAHENELASLRRTLQDKHEAELRSQSERSQQELGRVGRALAELETKLQLLQDQLEEAESGRTDVSTRLAKVMGERDQKAEAADELQAQLARIATLRVEEEQVIERVRKALAIGLSLLEDHRKSPG